MDQQRSMKVLALSLVLCLIVSMIPMEIIALPASGTPQTAETHLAANLSAATFQLDKDCKLLQYVDEAVFAAGNHVARLPEKETLNTYVFLNADGTQTVYYMDENVKFIDSTGAVREKDISLSATRAGFVTSGNDVALALPTNLRTGITLSYDGHLVTMTPENIASVTGRQRNGQVVYEGSYGANSALIYTPTLSGLKEDIRLDSYGGVNSFTFLLDTDGLRLYTNEQGRYYFAKSADADFKLELADIVAYDATGRFSLGAMTVTPITMGQQYRLTVTVDEEFLTAETTAYPVYIDPSITVSDNSHGANSIWDATIYSGKPTLNTGSWQYNHAGYYDSSYQTGRIVYKLSGLLNDVTYQSLSASDIQSVSFYLTEATGSAAATVNLYALNSNSTWTETNVTWNNVGSNDTVIQAQGSLSYNQTVGFDITNLVKAWKNGSYSSGQCGILLKHTNEQTATKGVFGCEYSTGSKRPYVVVSYALADEYVTVNEGNTATLSTAGISGQVSWEPTNSAVVTVSTSGVIQGIKAGQAGIAAYVNGSVVKTFIVYVTIPNGQYLIGTPSTAFYLSPDTITYETNTLIRTRSRSTDNIAALSQIWEVYYVGSGYYTISTLYKDDMRITGFDGITPALSTKTDGNVHEWEIQYNTSGYVLINHQYTSLALAPCSSGAATNNGIPAMKQYSSTDTSLRWQFTPTSANGLMLLDSTTGERRDEAYYSEYMPMWIDRNVTLSALGLDLHIFGNTGAYSIRSGNTSVVTYDSSTQTMYGHNYGMIVAYVEATISGTLYSLPFRLHICTDFANIEVIHDQAYEDRYSDYQTRIATLIQQLQEYYHVQFGILLNISNGGEFESYADQCPKNSGFFDNLLGREYYEIICDCAECENSYIATNGSCTEKDYHHTNIYNNLVRLPHSPNIFTLAYTGHAVCGVVTISGTDMEGCSTNHLGLASPVLGVALVADHTYSAISTTIHEVGHLFGARDHYAPGKTTEFNEDVGSTIFSDDCIYGANKDKDNIYGNLTLCSGCRRMIMGEDLLSSDS